MTYRKKDSPDLDQLLRNHKFVAPQSGWHLWAQNEGETIHVDEVGDVTVVEVDDNVMILRVDNPNFGGEKYLRVVGDYDSYDGVDFTYANAYEVKKQTRVVTSYDFV